MTAPNDSDSVVASYFVDEAGTPTCFGRRRRCIVGEAGNSIYFMLGALYVADTKRLTAELAVLRAAILANPYFKGVPSMQPGRRKTAALFHAKDDLPEIRYQVFQLLMRQDVSFYAVVRDKRCAVEEVRARNRADPEFWFRETTLYDDLASQLFKGRFHEAEKFDICFARRGARDRTAALDAALERARTTYETSYGVRPRAQFNISAANSCDQTGLQAADYFLWALQRLYERGEDRYWEFVRSKACLVHDIDDVRMASYGVYYTTSNPLTKAARAKR